MVSPEELDEQLADPSKEPPKADDQGRQDPRPARSRAAATWSSRATRCGGSPRANLGGSPSNAQLARRGPAAVGSQRRGDRDRQPGPDLRRSAPEAALTASPPRLAGLPGENVDGDEGSRRCDDSEGRPSPKHGDLAAGAVRGARRYGVRGHGRQRGRGPQAAVARAIGTQKLKVRQASVGVGRRHGERELQHPHGDREVRAGRGGAVGGHPVGRPRQQRAGGAVRPADHDQVRHPQRRFGAGQLGRPGRHELPCSGALRGLIGLVREKYKKKEKA